MRYDLYALLLKPVEADWKPAKNLIVVTNGALGLLPLSLLPTSRREIDLDDDPLFSELSESPVAGAHPCGDDVPSLSALRTLRKLPAGTASRQELIGFGDPVFSKEQADANASRMTSRSKSPTHPMSRAACR